jgi:hypothetical protein
MMSFSVTSFKKAISEFQEDSVKFSTQQKSDPLFMSGRSSEAYRRPPVSRRFFQFNVAYVRTSGQHVQTLFSFREESRFQFQTQIGKIACNRPNARTTSSGHSLNIKTCEARYGKAVAQFTVQTLYDSVRMSPREIRIKLVSSLLSL